MPTPDRIGASGARRSWRKPAAAAARRAGELVVQPHANHVLGQPRRVRPCGWTERDVLRCRSRPVTEIDVQVLDLRRPWAADDGLQAEPRRPAELHAGAG